MAELVVRSSAEERLLITDLDDTLWSRNFWGEQGRGRRPVASGKNMLNCTASISSFSASLASAGTLIGVASKNDSELAAAAFERNDLLLPRRECVSHRGELERGSQESVQRILKKWNILPDSVVFVDDSPMENSPKCRVRFRKWSACYFPKGDYGAFWAMLKHLRDQLGQDRSSPRKILFA